MSTGVFPRDVYRLLSAAQLEPTQWQKRTEPGSRHTCPDGAGALTQRLVPSAPSALSITNLSALVFFVHFSALVLHFSPCGTLRSWLHCQKNNPWKTFPSIPISTSSLSPSLLVLVSSEDLTITSVLQKCLNIFLRPCGFFSPPENRQTKDLLKKYVQLPLFSGTLFENILAIDGHTCHQPMQDRFLLYLYIKIRKKKHLIKCLKNVRSWGKSFLH